MKNLVLSMLAIASISVLSSCSSENDPMDEISKTDPGKDPIAITFGQNIAIYTKAPFEGNALAENSKIGLWATEYTESSAWTVPNKCDNKQLNVTAEGITFEGGDVYYSKVPNTKYDFHAYAPFAESGNGLTVNDAAASAAPSIGITLGATPDNQTDLMYATPLTGKTAQSDAYALVFNHALAQVKFTIYKDANVTLNNLTAISVKTKSTSTMSLTDGTFGTATTELAMTPLTASDTPVAIGSDENNKTPAGSAIMVFPEANVITEVTFAIDGNDYKFTPENVTLTKGKITTIDVKVTATGLKFTQSVTQWENETGHGSGEI